MRSALALLIALAAGGAAAAGEPRLMVQARHSSGINAIALSPDGAQAVSAGRDGVLRMWHLETGRLLRERAFGAPVERVAWAPGGGRIAALVAGVVHMLAAEDFELDAALAATRIGRDIALDASGARVAGIDKLVFASPPARGLHKRAFVADTASGTVLASLDLPADATPGGSIDLSADGTLAAVAVEAGGRGKVLLWDVKGGRIGRTIDAHASEITALALRDDGKLLLTTGRDGYARRWDAPGGRMLGEARIPDLSTGNAAFDAAGAILALASISDTRLFGLKDGALLATHPGGASAAAFPRDGSRVVSGFNDLKWRAISPSETAAGSPRTVDALPVHAAAWPVAGRAVLGAGASAVVWDLDRGKVAHAFPVVGGFAVSRDGATLYCGTQQGGIDVRDADTGTVLRTIPLSGGRVQGVSLSPGERLLLVRKARGEVLAIDPASGAQVARIAPVEDLLARIEIFVTTDETALVRVSAETGRGTVERFELPGGRRTAAMPVAAGASSIHAAVSPDGRMVARPERRGAATRVSLHDIGGKAVGEVARHADAGIGVEPPAATFSPDGLHLIVEGPGADGRLGHEVWRIADRMQVAFLPGTWGGLRPALRFRDAQLVVHSSRGMDLWEYATGRRLSTLDAARDSTPGALSPDGRFALAGSQGGTATLWDSASGRRIARAFAFSDGGWAVADDAGRFDASDLEEVRGLHWVLPDAPFEPAPLELFMRDYYEPGLLARLLNGESLPPVKALASISRAQPMVRIAGIEADPAAAGRVRVTVEAASRKGGARDSGVRDLRLFRDGQLVAHAPAQEGDVPLDAAGTARLTFPGIRLPSAAGRIGFSAYAFNTDGVKSATARAEHLPAARSAAPGRAYLGSVGVNVHENPAWNLAYAANDARTMLAALEQRLGSGGAYAEVVTVPLLSERPAEGTATKGDILAVLALLAGRPVDAASRARIPNAARLAAAGPDDLVVLTFSGHGYGERGAFYLLAQDTGAGDGKQVTDGLLRKALSSDELSRALREVDAGQFALVIDACHSAASVQGDGFKPGPMGSRGLGQLAFDKGMRVLAASQADDVALEADAVRQGLLSYALVGDGLDAGKADHRPEDRRITLAEWLSYGVARVPALAQEIRAGTFRPVTRGGAARKLERVEQTREQLARPKAIQQPVLFDFASRRGDVALESLR